MAGTMVVQKTGVLEMYYCPCNGCNRILVKLEKFLEVQQIDRDAEKHKAYILVTGDPYKVTKALRKYGKRFEYFEQTSTMNKVTKPLKMHHFEKSPPMKNQIPPKRFQVAAQPPDLEIDETIVKKTKVCCPECNHELELKRYNKRFACDGCKEDGFGSRYRCKDCDYSLHEECASPKPIISPDFLEGSAFKFCHQPCSTCARPCYACGKAIRGYFYRCKSKELDLHPYCSNLKRNLYDMDFVHHDKEISSSSKCVCCENKMRRGTKTKNSGSCSYISTCKKYHFHVYCITEMLHEAWKEGVINVSTYETSMPPEKMDLQLGKPNNSNRRGGRFGEILKTLSTFVGTIIGILLGDPTGMLVPVLIEFFLNTLPKLLSK